MTTNMLSPTMMIPRFRIEGITKYCALLNKEISCSRNSLSHIRNALNKVNVNERKDSVNKTRGKKAANYVGSSWRNKSSQEKNHFPSSPSIMNDVFMSLCCFVQWILRTYYRFQPSNFHSGLQSCCKLLKFLLS